MGQRTDSTQVNGSNSSDGSNGMLKAFLLFMPPILIVIVFYLGIVYNKNSLGNYYNTLYWFGMPIFAYVISTLCAMIFQLVTCKTVQMNVIMKSTWQMLVLVYAALGLSSFAIVRAPVISITPYRDLKGINDIIEIENNRKDEFLMEKAVTYYLFWAVFIGQLKIMGQTAICPS